MIFVQILPGAQRRLHFLTLVFLNARLDSLISDLESIAVAPWAEDEEREREGSKAVDGNEEAVGGMGERTPDVGGAEKGLEAAARSGERTRPKKRRRLRLMGWESASDGTG